MRVKSTLAIIVFILTSQTGAAAESRLYTLQGAYDAALAESEIIKLSEENALQAESRVDQALSNAYPRLTAGAAYTRFNEMLPPGGGSFLFQPLEQANASLILKQPLYTGGRTLAAWRAAKTFREISKKDFSTTKQAVMLGVAEAYYAVVKAKKQAEVGRKALERMERHKKVTEREAATRKNKANLSALLRANTLVNQARIALVRVEDGLVLAKNKLSLVAKLPKDIELAEPDELPAPQGTMASLEEAALINRDDYTSSQMNRKVVEEFVAITKGAHHPQIYAEGGVTYQDSHPATALDATVYYGGIRLQVPIFEGGLMKAEVAEARSKQRQAEFSTVLLRRQIESEVQEAYTTYQTASSVLETAKLLLEDARKNFDTVEGLFSEGLVQSLSLIDAETALSSAEKELISTTWDRQLAILRLEKSIGLLGKNEKARTKENEETR